MSDHDLREKLLAEVDNRRNQCVDIANYIYAHPEVSMQEKESSAYLAKVLENEGFDVTFPYCGLETAFKATKRNGEGPKICFMAEYDALPEIGHACGHQWIASTSLMAGIVTAMALSELPGEVTVFGTPGEETGDGKPVLVEHGAFNGYCAALEIHPNYTTRLEPEVHGIGGIDIEFTGKAAHAGEDPWNGVNALDAVIMLFNSINAMRQQLKDGSRVHAIITNGGEMVNTVPAFASVRLEYRSSNQDYLYEIQRKVLDCAEGAAKQTGCAMHWEHFEPTCQAMKTNKKLKNIFAKNMEKYPHFKDGDITYAGTATDVGNVSQIIPVIHPMMKMVTVEAGAHTIKFRDALLKSYAQDRAVEIIKILVETGLDILSDPEMAGQLKVE